MSGQQDVPAWLTGLLRSPMGWPWSAPSSSGPTQAINPGWAFDNVINVTEANSSSPATEHSIVAQESYGRQLGQVIGALVDIIEERPESRPRSDAMKDLIRLNEKIVHIKSERVDARIAEIEAFLAEVRKSDPQRYAHVASVLRRALADGA
jgi:hypothetical protein